MQTEPLNTPTLTMRTANFFSAALAWIRAEPVGAIGGLVIILFVTTAIFAPVIAPFSPFQMNTSSILVPPGTEHFFGTDELGRDIFSRLVWGARTSLITGFGAVIVGTTLGAVIGLVGGYMGGVVDMAIQRVMDTLMAFPLLILALTMVAALGPSVVNVILALSVAILPTTARVIRSVTLSLREQTYVFAAKSLGYSTARIIFIHILPNCLSAFIVIVTVVLGRAILAEAALSFLGLGTPPPTPSWGSMLSGNTTTYMYQAPWLAFFPGMAITLIVLALNLLGDSLRDTFDPRNTK